MMSQTSPPKKQKISENEDSDSDEECDLVRLSVEGMEEDPTELDICLTAEELQDYILRRIAVHKKNPEFNPVLKLKLDTLQLKKDVEEKLEELEKLKGTFEQLFTDRENFLTYVSTHPKITTKDVGVNVDLPLLLELMPKGAKKLFEIPCSSSSSSNAGSDTENGDKSDTE